jgi:16S rRNA processing protein RimM
VRGEVKIKTFTADPAKIAAYGPLHDESGTRSFKVKLRGQVRGLVIARLDGVEDRNAAEALKGMRLYVGRDKLPRPRREEWYLADLIGLRVERSGGAVIGTVKSVQNYGAGDLIEVAGPNGQTTYLPFTKRAVPEVDIEGGRLIAEPPDEIEWRPEAAEETDDETSTAERGNKAEMGE